MNFGAFINNLYNKDCFMVDDEIEVGMLEDNADPTKIIVSYWKWYDHNNLEVLTAEDFYKEYIE